MGTRGPVPKRSDQRRRTNSPSSEAVAVAHAAAVMPPADDEWHPVARRWYESLADSGQQQFYEASDWATAYLMAESMSRDLKPQFVGFAQTGRDTTVAEFLVIPLKGASLSAYLRAMSNLLVTEGDRRRAGLELRRAAAPERPDNVIDYRARVSAGA